MRKIGTDENVMHPEGCELSGTLAPLLAAWIGHWNSSVILESGGISVEAPGESERISDARATGLCVEVSWLADVRDERKRTNYNYLDDRSATRPHRVSARSALPPTADCGAEQRTWLAECLFSLGEAVTLLRSQAHPRPESGASDLIDRLEVHVLRTLILTGPA